MNDRDHYIKQVWTPFLSRLHSESEEQASYRAALLLNEISYSSAYKVPDYPALALLTLYVFNVLQSRTGYVNCPDIARDAFKELEALLIRFNECIDCDGDYIKFATQASEKLSRILRLPKTRVADAFSGAVDD